MTYPNNEIETNLIKKGFKYIAGVDEAGRGPLAGPVVSAAVILPIDFHHELLNDSKKVSKKNRNILYEYINENALAIGIGIIDNNIIDEINILEATKLSMIKAINNLKIKPDYIITDYVNLDFNNLSAFKKGDSLSITIASASIIAKVLRDKMMDKYDKLYPLYDFSNNKGYGTKKHLEALNLYGPTKIHRLSFNRVIK